MSNATLQVLSLLAERPTDEHYGLDICRATGLKGGTVYPILARLEKAGMVVSTWENIDPKTAGRSPRRNYQLTPTGREFVREALAQARRTVLRGWQPAPDMPRSGEASA